METCIDLIRHGEPVGGRMYRGSQTDHPLSPAGWQQMHSAITPLVQGAPKWDVIITSPMARCHEFAEVISRQYSIPLCVEEQLTEISFGAWEGKTRAEIESTDPVLFQQFQRDPVNHRPHGAESLEGFGQRIIASLTEVAADYRGSKVLLVSHGGVMRTLLLHVLDAPLLNRQMVRFPYAAMMRLVIADEDKWKIEL